MPWSTEHTHETTASPAAVWERWTTAEHWPQDDPGCRAATLPDPLVVGATGRVKSTGPAQRITFTEVEPLTSMVFEIRLPLAVLRLPHRMTPGREPGTVRVTHGVTIDGPLAPLWGLLVGRGLARHLPGVVRSVTTHAALAEASGA